MSSSPVVPSSEEFVKVFPNRKPIIGTVHLLPLPGSPEYSGGSMREIIERAVSDALTYQNCGVDGLIVENEGDIPFLKPDLIGPETVAAMTSVTYAVVSAVKIPVGVLCLANAAIQSLAIAKAAGGRFIRVNQWANAYVANEGIIEGAAAVAMRYRSGIYGRDIKVLADVHVKHGSHAIVADRSVRELMHDVEAFGADALIATGQRTGDPTRVEEVMEVASGASRPVLVGSGLDWDNAEELLTVADGAIVGSAMKEDGVWWNPVSLERSKRLMGAVEKARVI